MRIKIWSIVLLLALSVWAAAQETPSIISEIIVTGNHRVLKDVILAQMRTKVGQPYVQETLDRDKRSIEELGFFSAVDVRATPLDGGNYRLAVDVAEYPEIKEIRIVGNTAVKTEEILGVITLKAGQVFNLKARQESSTAINDLYTRKGFFLAGIQEFGPMTDSPSTINIVLVEAKVGTVSVRGNTKTKDWVMKRLIKTRTGDTFSITKWGNDLRRLYNTQWFDPVRSVEDTGKELGVVDLTAEVKEVRTGTFNIGLQLDPRSSLAGVIRVQETNLRGTGQSVGVNFIQATKGGGPSVDLDYSNPFIDSHDTTLRASVYNRLVYRFSGGPFGGGGLGNLDNFNERRTGGTIGLSRPVDDYLSLGASVRYETVKTNDDGTNFGNFGIINFNNNSTFVQQDGSVGVFSLSGVLNKRDVDIDPSTGSWVRLDVEPGFSHITNVGGTLQDKSILGSHSFIKNTVEYRHYWSPGQKPRGRDLEAPRTTIATRIKIGTISGKVPFFEQFFVGGADSLRGYDEDRFWGNNIATATVEFRKPIQKSFNAILFVDYGDAWGGYSGISNFSQTSKPDFHLGFGVGLSFRTPLGPIRLDLGFDEKGKSKTHFLIGTSF
ncbi:POTRA domain-containing protein [soil metagenome]